MKDFRWWSPLGASVALFLVWGLLYTVIGVAGSIVARAARENPPAGQFLYSGRAPLPMHPFIVYLAVAIAPATVLGWIGIK